MKVKTECKICGQRSKRVPLLEGYELCHKHYQMQKEKEKKIDA